MPFRLRDDIATADVAFEVWGGTLQELFISAAEALLKTMSAAPEQVLRRKKLAISLEHDELDLLLLSFLQELIFYKDARRLLLHGDMVQIEERDGTFRLSAVACGEEIDAGRHRLLVDVKAVTLHRLKVQLEDDLWKALLVLDV